MLKKGEVKMIHKMIKEGLSKSAIARKLGLSRDTVSKYAKLPEGHIPVIKREATSTTVDAYLPHIARMLFQTADHRILIPASAIIGAILLLVSDIISQLPTYSGTLPINSITAILGIPIVIFIIIKNKI